MSFFLLLFIAFLVYFVAIPLWRVYSAVNRQRRAMRDFFGQARSGQQNDRSRSGFSRPSQQPRRKKKIDPNIGEYVEFEEIESTTTTQTAEGTTTDYRRESQVTDVEWEDVK